ncbi:MAG: hypothetical protein RIT45_374 [Pseudomonadota bacterium]
MSTPHDDRPAYDRHDGGMLLKRAALGPRFARQIAATAGTDLPRPLAESDVCDLGCGYGYTAAALAELSRSVVGIEPSEALAHHAEGLAAGLTGAAAGRLRILRGGYQDLGRMPCAFDLVVMDNVFEHIADQRAALGHVATALRPGGVLYLLVPNKLWPIEHHYHLPALGWLPLPLANAYLRASGRGERFDDAAYAPTVWKLGRLLDETAAFDWSLRLPADLSLTQGGGPLYRVGAGALARFPQLWAISKALLVVARRRGDA